MPKKTLEEMLNENIVQPGTKDAKKRLATFLSHWDEIEDAYKKGWPWTSIYEALFQAGIIDYSYSTFIHYKNKRRRRELEAMKHEARTRSADDAKGASVERGNNIIAPGSTRAELPVFGQGSRQREPKRF